MGQHSRDDTGPGRRANPAGPGTEPASLLGWGIFSTALATVLTGWVGDDWWSGLPVAGLGAGATAVLYLAAHLARPARSDRPKRRATSRPPEATSSAEPPTDPGDVSSTRKVAE